MKLLIISNMAHYRDGDRVLGWGPAVRELNFLATAFDQVRHLAMLCDGPPPPTARAYSSNVALVPLTPAGGGVLGKLEIAIRTPRYLRACVREIRLADAVYLRCPSNVSLEALLLLAVLRKPKLRLAKYAGNWHPTGPEPFFYRLQRRLLERGIHGGRVTVNGEWPDQPAHVSSLHNPCLMEDELRIARNRTKHKNLGKPLRFVFAGQLRRTKGVDRALRILYELRLRGWQVSLDIAGDGPENRALRELTGQLELSSMIRFHGWLSTAALHRLFQRSHFLLLASSSEGWPKVLGEAMAFRCVPVAAAVSCIPQILGEGYCGIVRPAGDIAGFVNKIEYLARDPREWRRVADNAQSIAANFTFEAYFQRMREILRPTPDDVIADARPTFPSRIEATSVASVRE